MIRLIGLAIIVGAVGWDSAFIDPPSAIIVILCSWGILLMAFGHDWRAFGVLGNAEASRTELLLGHAALVRLRSAVCVSGTIGSLIGVVIMISVEDPNLIGRGMAILLLTQVYALALAFCVIHPIAGVLAQRLDEAPR